jgi:hypothetical protein
MKVEIKQNTYKLLDARADEKDFDNTEEYIQHLLDQVVERIKNEKTESSGYSDEEEKEVKDRLKDLGYMD